MSKKNFTIEPFKHVLGPDFEEKALKNIQDAVEKIYKYNASDLNFFDLYADAYNLVLRKSTNKLYFGIMKTLADQLRKISKLVESADDENFLEEFNRNWINHNKALDMIQCVVLYMDKIFIKNIMGVKTIREIGFRHWIDFVIGSKGVRNRLPVTLVQLVLREIKGEVIKTGLTGNIIKMLMDLGMPDYDKNFKKPFLSAFEDFYGSVSLELINVGDCGDYLMEAERRINEEWVRVSDYLDPSCESKIISVIVKQMIENHMPTLVHKKNSGLVNMLMDDNYEDLERMYRLFSRTPSGLTVVKDVMTSFIQDTGEKLIKSPKRLIDPEDFAKCLLALKYKYDNIIKMAFNSDEIFQDVLNSAFEFFINFNAKSDVHMENSSLVRMFRDDKYEDLERLYNLFHSVPYGLVIVKDVMTSFIRNTGKALIMDPERLKDPENFAKCLLALKYKYDNIIKTAFNSDKIFKDVLNSAFEYFINFNANSVVHMENSKLLIMLKQDKYADLEIMFREVPYGLTIVKDVMTSFIQDTGEKLIMDPERLKDPVNLVQRLLDLKDKYDEVIKLVFNNDQKFHIALKSAFEYIINLNSHSPEFISLFMDEKFRKGLKGVGEDDVEILLEKVMVLFRCLQEKDMFEKYYKQHLAKRLLSGKTVSDEAERSLIVKLKTECGNIFTSKLEQMLTDMKTSSDMLQKFLNDKGAELGDSPALSVQVLTSGSWPIQSRTQCNLPSDVLGAYETFRNYYLGEHRGRRLSWQANMGTADLMATFGDGRKHELNVSTYQMCVLMLFNNANRLSCKEIEQATAIPMPDLKRCLQSLALTKGTNVLRKEPMSKDIAEDDAFFFNDKFTSRRFKVKIGTVAAQRESEPESVETRQRVEEDRKPQIDAAIVRVMKFRKVLEHNNIIAEVTKQLQARFLPNPVVIKKRIESLIERGFLVRDEADRKMYRYLA